MILKKAQRGATLVHRKYTKKNHPYKVKRKYTVIFFTLTNTDIVSSLLPSFNIIPKSLQRLKRTTFNILQAGMIMLEQFMKDLMSL
jgi:hypothetical protein